MNQEQNNLNPNNFNTQGNNRIPNNQPLNNQSFNQGMGVNQQPINPQPRPTPSFQQSIMQEITPQPMNTFESNNANNTSFNSETPKKLNICLITGIIIAIAVIGTGVIVGTKVFNKENTSSNNKIDYIDNIQNGNIKLTMTSKNKINRYNENIIFYENYEYFETTNDKKQFIIIDSKGKQVLPIEGKKLYEELDENYKYLGDGYFIYNTTTKDNKITAVVVKNGKLIISLDSYSTDYYYIKAIESNYKDGILYASSTQGITIAYDLKEKKELWKFDGTLIKGYVLDDDFLRVQTTNNRSGDTYGFLQNHNPNTILDYNGNKIISGGDIKMSEDYEYDTQIETSRSSSYLEIKKNEHIKIYDLNHNLKTTISLKETDNSRYSFYKLLYSGIFLVLEIDKQTNQSNYILYNENGEILLKEKYIKCISYAEHIAKEYVLPKEYDLIEIGFMFFEEENPCILIKNGKIVKKYDRCKSPNNGYGIRNNYLFYYEKSEDKPLTKNGETYNIINLNNMKTINAPVEYTDNTDILNESPNGEYVILTTGNKNYVYDSNFNLKYESDWLIKPVNDKYVISSNIFNKNENEEMITNLINVETGKVNKLNVKGEYYDNNANGLVTYDGTSYYLYSFN